MLVLYCTTTLAIPPTLGKIVPPSITEGHVGVGVATDAPNKLFRKGFYSNR